MTRADLSLETNRQKMKALLTELTTGGGPRDTIADGVKLARSDGAARAAFSKSFVYEVPDLTHRPEIRIASRW